VNGTEESLALARRIDKSCDAFEAAWNSGARPRIESFLQHESDHDFDDFLQALLSLEIELRKQTSEPGDIDEYHRRFPQHRDIVETTFQMWQEYLSMAGLSTSDTDSQTILENLAGGAGAQTIAESPTDGLPRLPLPRKFGRYRVAQVLGQGAMGCVLLAEDTELQRPVALKIPRLADGNAALFERFQREARSAAQLQHANICPIHEVGEILGTRYIAMAYIEGRPLSDYVQAEPSFTERQVARLIVKLAKAVQHAHDHGIVHRDLKPANVMLDASQEPIIMDFGLAVQIREDGDPRLTRTGTQIGSPAYMSPEQVDGNPARIGPATDIYSLGIVAYELLTGVTPYRGGVALVLSQILMRDPEPPSTHCPGLSDELEGLCLKMMARRPEDRFESMSAVADAWLDFLRQSSSGTALNEPGVMPAIPARVRLDCVHCGNSLRLVRSHAGGAVRCPRCEGKLSVAADLSTVTSFVPASRQEAMATLDVSDSDTEPGTTAVGQPTRARRSDAAGWESDNLPGSGSTARAGELRPGHAAAHVDAG